MIAHAGFNRDAAQVTWMSDLYPVIRIDYSRDPTIRYCPGDVFGGHLWGRFPIWANQQVTTRHVVCVRCAYDLGSSPQTPPNDFRVGRRHLHGTSGR